MRLDVHYPYVSLLLTLVPTVSPNGMMFAKERVRKSLLAKMVGELLETRVMVKGSMKAVADDKVRPCLSPSLAHEADIALVDLAGPHQAPQRSPARPQVPRQRASSFLSLILPVTSTDSSNPQVTYGYTSATFSGRMPAVEVADAIVQTGRESLEKVRLYPPLIIPTVT